MNPKYLPAEVEAAARSHWAAHDAYRVIEDPNKPKFYACSMLPYPSGKLHMGHVRNYTINDMLTRHLRMKGFNVLMPMGWDAFGLPAENAAIKNRVPPAKWTYDNIAHMKGQMQAMGLAIDWSREVATCSPDYYRWNQWLFLKMLEKGIAERRTQVVNWDPVDQTVLANEQVVDGRGWRSGALVEKREIPGYYLRITQYAQELLQQVKDGLPGWPDRVKAMQENWIGKSTGVRFAFTHDVRGEDGALVQEGRLHVFTTRADTIMGVTFCAVAPEHPLATWSAARDGKVAAFVEACRQGGTTEAELAIRDKEGVPTGLSVRHPMTGAAVPVWVGNYVLMGYGDGAVMGVPAHDERDFAFALKYGLPIRQVIARAPVQGSGACGAAAADPVFDDRRWHDWYADKQGVVCVNSGELDGLGHDAAVDRVATLLGVLGLGEKRSTWRLRDWGISRQRYWGTPIPIIHCDGTPEQAGCGAVPVPEAELPVVLPEDLIPDGSGNPLNQCEPFLKVKCPQCGRLARRETDTMDTFVDSSWYFMRYCDPKDAQRMVGAGTAYWMAGMAGMADRDGAGPAEGGVVSGHAGMDQYIGGIEHAILHLLYARFWTKVMRDLGLVRLDEPFTRLLTQGMVLNHIYSRRSEKGGIEYFWPHEVENVLSEGGKIVGAQLRQAKGELPAGTPITYEGVGTMSKSRNNGVDPQELIDRYGADTARLFVMFAAPPEQTLEWSDAGVEGSHRFLKRVWALGAKHGALLQRATAGDLSVAALGAKAKALRREVHLVLKQVSYDFERMQYNTVVSGCMKLLNTLEAFEPATVSVDDADAGDGLNGAEGEVAALCEGVSVLLRALYPACPHLAHGLWTGLGYAGRQGDLLDAPWPQVDEAALVQDEVELVLQIAGKMRGSIRVAAHADQAMIEAAALASPEFARFAEGRAPRKVVIVPGRLVNVVV